MDLEELRGKKEAAETALAKAISKIIDNFLEATGYCPSEIKIRLIDVTAIGDKRKSYELERVEMKIDTGL
jgi:hypothetical protein